jgi:hypothetical protein
MLKSVNKKPIINIINITKDNEKEKIILKTPIKNYSWDDLKVLSSI